MDTFTTPATKAEPATSAKLPEKDPDEEPSKKDVVATPGGKVNTPARDGQSPELFRDLLVDTAPSGNLALCGTTSTSSTTVSAVVVNSETSTLSGKTISQNEQRAAASLLSKHMLLLWLGQTLCVLDAKYV